MSSAVVSVSKENGCLYSHIRWGEAFVVVYSVTCKRSFQEARGLLKQLADLRLPSYFTALLLGNKRDLDHAREVCVDEGQQLSLAHGCQFYEVSAAESPAGAALAFQALLREARSVQLLRALPIRRKLGVHSVSRGVVNSFQRSAENPSWAVAGHITAASRPPFYRGQDKRPKNIDALARFIAAKRGPFSPATTRCQPGADQYSN
ncbi:Ras-related and estrogen-regulated growth inhibitor [Melipona quadrifasciata]|uniref:small monomeric GTPase n=1 Tax=Melipona quadrifasciata TaxID=166423 RepID=A0A0M8ZXD1_9HYME|nr:Ras-related and estrogen-regulated growth inhibitor [Melipona quadrifasciata]